MFFEMRFDLGTLDSGERSLPFFLFRYLAHLSRKLIGELMGQVIVRRRPHSSVGWGNESLFKWSWSHDQDGHHAHRW